MKRSAVVGKELEDWEILCSFLPSGWEQKARECGALTRARGVAGANPLLRLLLIHIAGGCSLTETSVRARQMGLGELNPSAVYKRLRAAEEWLRWMADQLRGSLGIRRPPGSRRIRVADATAISEPGSTGTDWRIHYALDLANLQCDYFELTDVGGGETWRRFPVSPGDILLGDRGYSHPPGIGHVVAAGGDVVVRLNRTGLPLFDEKGKRLEVLRVARPLQPRQNTECAAWVRPPKGEPIRGRLLIVRRSKQAAEQARKKLRQQASKKQVRITVEALEAAQYFFVWTTLPASWSRAEVLELYRSRWQIELAFKRMKSIMGWDTCPRKIRPVVVLGYMGNC